MNIKKGQMAYEDIFYVMAYLFFAGLLFFFIYFTYNTHIKPELSGSLNNAVPALDKYGDASMNVSTVLEQTSGGVSTFNNIFPLLLIGLVIMTLISAYYMGSHPVFFFVSLVVLLVVVILAVVFSNTFQQITTATEFGSTINTFNITNIFMKYLPFIMVIIVIIVVVVMSLQGSGGRGAGI